MKKLLPILILLLLSACSSDNQNEVAQTEVGNNTVSAQGGEVGNGGDPCENRVQVIRDDIKSWIQGGGAENLSLPKNIEILEYKTKMLLNIRSASISCTDKTLKLDSVEKTCINTTIGDVKKITCNLTRFNNLIDEDQYKLVHHEYAGLSGLETNLGTWESSYILSNQLSRFLESVTVKRLTILPQKLHENSFFRNTIYGGPYDDPSESYRIYDVKELVFVFSKSIKLCYIPEKIEEACNYLTSVIKDPKFSAYGSCDISGNKIHAWLGFSTWNGTEVEYDISIPACTD